MAVLPSMPTRKNFKDLTGVRFTRLLVIRYAGPSNGASWLCQCDCGEQTIVKGINLMKPAGTKSCGCLFRDRESPARTHGMTGSPEWITWAAMKARCSGVNDRDAKDYSERGIAVCERWSKSFEAFFADMGPRPSPRHSIDRIDTNGSYEPGNCRWATVHTQTRNKRSNVWLEANGERLVVADWAAKLNISRYRIYLRLRRGWSTQEALFGRDGSATPR